MKRVVITGMGVITPIGNDINTYWNNLLEGVCGIDHIKSFPTDDLPVKIAGEVKDFNPAEYGIEPECDLNYTPNKPVEAGLTIAVSDSLGFGGHNGCVAFRKYVD